MAEFRQSSPLAGEVLPRRLLPPPALCGFLLLLVLIFSVAYAVGSAAGPVAPGIHGTGNSGSGSGGGGGVEDMPGMHGSRQ
ncbi:hypothetical protein OG895_30555 [Streptomyces sp. NBC_00201]|uniref:hypothetical protein n=1 Tax=unclassified Streptomyces TaxID=2593676 RepID=UPI00224E0529|nr:MULTISPECIES: hypothetical protein [unclassified Streptomyces]MCX5051620.1 hypothetical protein [Streptomyces sp. NBC_00474]MCX5249511.1 hypothetical protein [Streptomyces sp. NBC_00201]